MIKIIKTEGGLEVESPYNKEFVDFAHMRNGVWSDEKERWIFDPRDEHAVRSALVDIYGTDNYENCDKKDVRFEFSPLFKREKDWILFACGLWFAKNKSNYVKLNDHVAVVQGKLKSGSKYITAEGDTIIELRQVPEKAAEKFYREHPEHVEIMGGLEEEKLRDEKKSLQKRIEEIEKTLQTLQEDNHEDKIIPDLAD